MGVTKKPQDDLLKNFSEKAKNFAENVVYSILYHILKQPQIHWISKLRALYCIDALLKNKKYFTYFSKNRGIFEDFGMEKLRGENPSGFKNLEKLLQEIKTKLNGEFETQHVKGDNFDLNMLEQMKEKTNQQFFNQMEGLSKEEKQKPKEQKKDNLLDLFVDQTPPEDKKKVEKEEKQSNLDLDFFGDAQPQKQAPSELDLLNLF